MKEKKHWKLFSLLFALCISLFSYQLALAGKDDPILGKRTVRFVNQCSFPVWFGLISGTTTNKLGGKVCQTDADCRSGSECVDRGLAGKECFWKNPAPANGQFELSAHGGSNIVEIPIYQNGLNYAWSGAMAGRTDCAGGVCGSGDCEGGTGACKPGKGFTQPATQAEVTFNNDQRDYYDIEVVNGMNIPVEMGPTLMPARMAKLKQSNDPYYCGNPGGVQPITAVGSCNWNMTPPSNDYKWVPKGGAACATDSDCQSPNICGLSYDPKLTPKLHKTCGKLMGYWSANQVCGNDRTMGAPFNCAQQLPVPDQNHTMFDLYGCKPIESCYKDGAQSNCCGCVNWDQLGLNVPAAPLTKQCDNSNTFWVDNVLQALLWFKQACSTVYTYPFDDPSSTFTCDNRQNGSINTQDYTITFCPGGQTGGVV